MKTYKKEKEDDIIFNKPTIISENYPEIMWKKTSTDTFVKSGFTFNF